MSVIVPPGVSSDGMVKVSYVPAIAGEAPTIAELNALTAIDLSCYLTRTGFAPNASENTATDERLCSKQVYEDFGTVTYTIGDLVYVYDAQDLVDTEGVNRAYLELKRDTVGFLVVAWGKEATEEWAAGDVVDIYPVKLGVQRKQQPESNSKLKVAQRPYVRGEVREDQVVLAA